MIKINYIYEDIRCKKYYHYGQELIYDIGVGKGYRYTKHYYFWPVGKEIIKKISKKEYERTFR
jgi:hypothetical protein